MTVPLRSIRGTGVRRWQSPGPGRASGVAPDSLELASPVPGLTTRLRDAETSSQQLGLSSWRFSQRRLRNPSSHYQAWPGCGFNGSRCGAQSPRRWCRGNVLGAERLTWGICDPSLDSAHNQPTLQAKQAVDLDGKGIPAVCAAACRASEKEAWRG